MKQIFIVLIMLTLCMTAFAQEEQIVVNKSDIPKELLEKIQLEQKMDTYGKWVGLGKEIGEAVDGSLNALSENAVELSETNIGKMAIFLVLWKFLFMDIVQIAVGICFIIIVTIMMASVYSKCIKPRTVLESKKGDVEQYKTIFPGGQGDSLGGGLVLFALCTVGAYALCCLVMFI